MERWTLPPGVIRPPRIALDDENYSQIILRKIIWKCAQIGLTYGGIFETLGECVKYTLKIDGRKRK
jgi:hypothetical protein